jgi:hypothetical protein
MQRYVMLIDGELKGFHSADPAHEPVKIFMSMGTQLMPPSDYLQDPRDPIRGEEILDVCERLSDGSLRRTVWRIR